jgi:putative oxidoreductase
LVAAFVIHAEDGFGKQELPLLYATIYLVIALAGAGKASIDHWIYVNFISKNALKS